MPFSFYSNFASEQGSLLTTCLFAEESETNAEWIAENDSPVQLGPPPAIAYSSDEEAAAQKTIQELSPSNPSILFASDNNGTKGGCRISCSRISVVSSARTIEVYSSGEYVGTFRGYTLPTQTADTSPSQTPPLFLVQIEDQSLPRSSRDILIKFFIPKKPVAFQDTLSLHWLVLQGALPSSKAATSSSSRIITDESVPSTSASDSQDQQPADMRSGSLHSLGPAGLCVPSIDVEKVREMLGQIQIDALPQGAKDLMRTMEIQSRAMSMGMTGPGLAMNSGSAPQPQLLASFLNQSPAKALASNSDAGSCTKPVYVTKAELDQMEERIMNTIEQRFKQLEERILSSLNIPH